LKPTTEPDTLQDAIIVRLQPLRDADLIAVFLAPDRGRIDTFARSARKSSKRFGGRLQPFAMGTATLGRSRGSMPSLKAFEPRAALLRTGVSYEQLALASYAAELAVAAAQPEHADAHLHAWLGSALVAVDGINIDAPRILPWTKLALDISWLAAAGALADPTTCVDCGEPTSEGARWTPATGGPVCRSCASPAALNVSPTLLAAADALATQIGDAAIIEAIRGESAGDLEFAIGAQVAEILPSAPRSLRGMQKQFFLADRR